MKKFIIAIWIVLMTYLISDMGYEYYRYYQYMQHKPLAIKLAVETSVATINIEADNNVEWELIAKILTLVLITYGGVKLINKKVK